MYLIFDCETSGFRESRLIQLGMILLGADFKPIMEASLLVKPDGFQIEQGATDVHGITQEHAERHGLPQDVALMLFVEFTRRASTLVCHNVEHDRRVMEGELSKARWPTVDKPYFCTKREMVQVCKLPPSEKMLRAGRRGYKDPKLIEAYQHAFGEGFEGAHDAMADCRATARLFAWIKSGARPQVREDSFGQPVAVWRDKPFSGSGAKSSDVAIYPDGYAPAAHIHIVKTVYEPVCFMLPKCAHASKCLEANNCLLRQPQEFLPPPPLPPS